MNHLRYPRFHSPFADEILWAIEDTEKADDGPGHFTIPGFCGMGIHRGWMEAKDLVYVLTPPIEGVMWRTFVPELDFSYAGI